MAVELCSIDMESNGAPSIITFRGTTQDIITVAHFLSWIAATFRLPQANELSCSTVSTKSLPPTPDAQLNFCLHLDALLTMDSQTVGTCWKPLFPSTVVAYGFPVPRCPGTVGLRIPIGAMLEMAEILYDVNLEDDDGKDAGTYFDGIVWRLYPTAYNKEQNTVQWHLIPKTAEDENQAFAPDSGGGPGWLRNVSLDTLESATAVLGYCGDVVIRLGTESRVSDYEKYRFSRANIERPRPEASVGSASASIGWRGSSASVAAQFKTRKGLSVAVREAKKLSYRELLDHAEVEPVILFETERGREKAWLVPQLSVILDLLNLWACRNGISGIKYAAPGPDGGAQAKKVLGNSDYAKKELVAKILDNDPEVSVAYKVKQIYGQIQQRIKKNSESDQGARGTFTVGKEAIGGWDLLEVAGLSPSVSERRNLLPDKEETPCWKLLTKQVAIFSGQGMGELITPARTDEVCRHWYPIPGGFENNYLVATVRCMKALAMYSGNAEPIFLRDNIIWEFRDPLLFQPCGGCRDDPKMCAKQPQRLAEYKKKIRKKAPQGGDAVSLNERICEDGAIVFGIGRKSEKLLNVVINTLNGRGQNDGLVDCSL